VFHPDQFTKLRGDTLQDITIGKRKGLQYKAGG
jgi:hypothetical protein